jgi:hypothetical protein
MDEWIHDIVQEDKKMVDEGSSSGGIVEDLCPKVIDISISCNLSNRSFSTMCQMGNTFVDIYLIGINARAILE